MFLLEGLQSAANNHDRKYVSVHVNYNTKNVVKLIHLLAA